MNTITVKEENSKCVCQCPKNFNVIKKFHDFKGCWNREKNYWEFNKLLIEDIKKLMKKYFGVENGEFESCQLIIKDLTTYETLKGIIISGFELCRAFWRDSGAVLGDGVVLIDGKIDSGGSKNWWTTKCEDATFKILYFPCKMLKNPSIKRLIENEQIEIID